MDRKIRRRCSRTREGSRERKNHGKKKQERREHSSSEERERREPQRKKFRRHSSREASHSNERSQFKCQKEPPQQNILRDRASSSRRDERVVRQYDSQKKYDRRAPEQDTRREKHGSSRRGGKEDGSQYKSEKELEMRESREAKPSSSRRDERVDGRRNESQKKSGKSAPQQDTCKEPHRGTVKDGRDNRRQCKTQKEPHKLQKDGSSKTVPADQSSKDDQLETSGARKLIHGIVFQLLFLTLLHSDSKFDLWSEVEQAGLFDDIIYGIWERTTYVLHFIQAKHIDSDTLKPITTYELFRRSRKSDLRYSVYLYFDAYCKKYEDRKKFHPNVDKTNCKYYYFFHTNRKINKEIETLVTKVPRSNDLLTISSSGSYYKFNKFSHEIYNNFREIAKENEIKDNKIDSMIEEFRETFILVTNLAECVILEKEIEEKIQTKIVNRIQGQYGFTFLKTILEQNLFKWFQKNKIENFNLESTTKMLASLYATHLTGMNVNYLRKEYNAGFNEHALRDWHVAEFLDKKAGVNSCVLNVTSCKGSQPLTVLRVLATIENFNKVSYRIGDYVFMKMEYLLSHKNNNIVNVFESNCKLIVNECANKEEEKKFRDNFSNYYEKLETVNKQLIVISEQSLTEQSIRDDTNFDHLDSHTQNKLLEKQVLLQGSRILLSELQLKEEDYHRVYDAECITKIMTNTDLEFLSPLNLPPDYDVNTYIERRFNLDGQSYSEEQLINFQKEFIIVSDVPGMGQSSLLASLAKKFKKRFPEFLCVPVNLSAHGETFEKQKYVEIDEVKALNFILDSLKCHKQILKRSIFDAKVVANKIILLLDGFDEVEVYTNIVLDLIKHVKNHGGFRIFLTTRPNTVEILKKHSKVLFIKLEEISYDEHLQLFLQTVSQKSDYSCTREDGERFLKKFKLMPDFIGVPLFTKMFGEMYSNENVFDGSNLDLAGLYKKFMQKKCERYHLEKKGTKRAYFHRDKEIKTFMKYHQFLACRLFSLELLTDDDRKYIEEYSKEGCDCNGYW